MNRQRGFTALLELGIWLAGIAIVGGIIWGAWYALDHWHNAAYFDMQAERDAVIAERDALRAEKLAAQAEATRLRLAWAADSVAAQKALIAQEGERNARFVPVDRAARNLPAAVARSVFPAPAARVLDGAISAGNAAIARPTGEPAKEPAAVTPSAEEVDVAGVVDWGVTVAVLYSACADQVRGWQDFYSGLQRKQTAEQLH